MAEDVRVAAEPVELAPFERSAEQSESGAAIAQRFGVKFVAFWLIVVLRLAQWTWRYDKSEFEPIDRRIANREKILLAFWHGKYLPLFVILAGRGACVFAGESFRGAVIALICRHFGHACVLLPSNRGLSSLRLVRDALNRHHFGAVAIDGPSGPNRQVKSGVVKFASQFGFTLVPISVSSRRRWISTKRWDFMHTPKPFTKIALAVGRSIPLTPTGDEAPVREQIRLALNDVDARAELRFADRR